MSSPFKYGCKNWQIVCCVARVLFNLCCITFVFIKVMATPQWQPAFQDWSFQDWSLLEFIHALIKRGSRHVNCAKALWWRAKWLPYKEKESLVVILHFMSRSALDSYLYLTKPNFFLFFVLVFLRPILHISVSLSISMYLSFWTRAGRIFISLRDLRYLVTKTMTTRATTHKIRMTTNSPLHMMLSPRRAGSRHVHLYESGSMAHSSVSAAVCAWSTERIKNSIVVIYSFLYM